MSVIISEIASAGIFRLYDTKERCEAAYWSIRLHLANPSIDQKSRRLKSIPGKALYIFPLGDWRVLWEWDGDDKIVWSVRWLIATRKS